VPRTCGQFLMDRHFDGVLYDADGDGQQLTHSFLPLMYLTRFQTKSFSCGLSQCAAWLLPSSAFITQQWKQPIACVMKHFRSEHLNHYLQLVIK